MLQIPPIDSGKVFATCFPFLPEESGGILSCQMDDSSPEVRAGMCDMMFSELGSSSRCYPYICWNLPKPVAASNHPTMYLSK
jgi:hypothetical protein